MHAYDTGIHDIMASMEAIPGIVGIIQEKVVQERKTFVAVSKELKQTYSTVTCGLSTRSIRRFCKVHSIHVSSRLSDTQLDRVISSSVAKVLYILVCQVVRRLWWALIRHWTNVLH